MALLWRPSSSPSGLPGELEPCPCSLGCMGPYKYSRDQAMAIFLPCPKLLTPAGVSFLHGRETLWGYMRGTMAPLHPQGFLAAWRKVAPCWVCASQPGT